MSPGNMIRLAMYRTDKVVYQTERSLKRNVGDAFVEEFHKAEEQKILRTRRKV